MPGDGPGAADSSPPPAARLPDAIHPRAAAARAAAAGAPTADLPPLALDASTPFADDGAYLEHQFLRLRMLLEAAVAASISDLDGQRRAIAQAAAVGEAIGGRLKRTPAPIGLEGLRARYRLSDFEVDTILHALALTLDPTLAKLHSRISGAAWRSWVDVGFIINCHFDGVAARLRARQHFLAEAPLVKHRLVVLDRSRPEGRENLLACEVKLPPRVARLVLGQDPTGGASPYSHLVEPNATLDQVVVPEAVRRDLEQLVEAQPQLAQRLGEWGLDRIMSQGRGVVVLLTGPPGTGKSTLAGALAGRLGKRLLVVEAQKLLEAQRQLEEQVDDLFLEARLQDAVLLFDECEFLFGARAGGNRLLGTMLAAIDRFDGLAVMTTNLPERLDPALDRRVLLRINLEVPSPALREKIWQLHLPAALPLGPDVSIPLLAKRYDFSGGYIKNAVLLAASRALARGHEPRLDMADLDAAAQAQLRGDLSSYAERTSSGLSIDVLILPEDIKSQIVEIIAAGRNRSQVLFKWGFNETIPTGRGLVTLLSGDPGTGKTLSAEVIAAELGMSLYRINPAKVVSKFVGETEKNLNEILAQAKSMHAILFFDEADALFSTRVQKIESANDRFVNMETNFLLQQLERFEGIVILATNLETAIDQAFKRRIHYHIVIPFPDPPARERIWRGLMPKNAPMAAQIDFPKLGKTFDLSGGHIKNAVMRAAYMAAQAGSSITQALLADAAEKECAAAGKLFQHR